MRNWSLRKRIFIAVTAIAVIHLAFYVGPRWWYTRPRFYPKGYEKAVSILKEEFGEAAVERGVFSIPKDAVVVPYKGFAKVQDTLSRTEFHVYLAGDGAYFYFDGLRGKEWVALAARTTAETGRDAWAELAYLERTVIRGDITPDCEIQTYGTYTVFCDRVRLDRGVENGSYDAMERMHEERGVISYAKSELRARAVRAILEANSAVFASEAEQRREVLRAILGASVPPRSSWDRERILRLAGAYGEIAGEGDLGTLRRLKSAQFVRPWYWFAYRLPVIGTWLEAKRGLAGYVGVGPMAVAPRSDHLMSYVNLDGHIWAVEALAGKSSAERLRVLSETAFGSGRPDNLTIVHEAGKRLAREFPQEYGDLLAGNFRPFYDESKIAADPSWWAKTIAADEPLARLIAAEPYRGAEPSVCAALYRMTGDKSYLDRLKDVVRARIGRDRSRAAMRALLDAYAKDRSLVDIPEFAREVLGVISLTTEGEGRDPLKALWLGTNMIDFMIPADDSRCVEILSELVNEPEKVLEAAFAQSPRGRTLWAEAAKALGRSGLPEARDALMRKAESPGFLDDKTVAACVLRGLAISGEPRALPVLRDLAVKAFLDAVHDGGANAIALGPGRDFRNAAAAAAAVELASAPDRCERFATLDLAEVAGEPKGNYANRVPARTVIPSTVLSCIFSADDLRLILADYRCAEVRGNVITALYIKERRLLDGDVRREWGNLVIENTKGVSNW